MISVHNISFVCKFNKSSVDIQIQLQQFYRSQLSNATSCSGAFDCLWSQIAISFNNIIVSVSLNVSLRVTVSQQEWSRENGAHIKTPAGFLLCLVKIFVMYAADCVQTMDNELLFKWEYFRAFQHCSWAMGNSTDLSRHWWWLGFSLFTTPLI